MFAELTPDQRPGGEADRTAEDEPSDEGPRAMLRLAKIVESEAAQRSQGDTANDPDFEPISRWRIQMCHGVGGQRWERWGR